MTLAKSHTHKKYKNDRLLSFNPNSGKKLGEVSICNADEVRAAVRQARAAQRNWAAQSLAARIKIIRQVQETLVDKAQEIAGNGVVHKPSEYTPLTALHLQKLFYGARLPSGLLQTVPGGAATSRDTRIFAASGRAG